MPKSREQSKIPSQKNAVIRTKLKIGGRGSKQSAQQLSNKDLLEAIENTNRARDIQKLRTVARKRGLAV